MRTDRLLKSWNMTVKRTWRIFLNTTLGTSFIYTILASFQYTFSSFSENLPYTYPNLEEGQHDLFLFLINLVILLIPIIGYSIWIIRSKYLLYCKTRKSEFQLLKYQGVSTQQLKKFVLLDTFLIILFSVGFSFCFGNFIAIILFKNAFSLIFAPLELLSWSEYFFQLCSFQNFLLSLGITIFLIFFGWFSGMNWINREFELTYSDPSIKSRRRLEKNTSMWVSVIISCILFVPTLLPLFINQVPQNSTIYHVSFSLGLVSPILVIIFGALIWRAVFPYFISIISKRMAKSKKTTQSWRVFHFVKDWNYYRSEYRRKTFLFSLIFGLVVTGIGFHSNYQQNTVLRYLFINGNGVYQRVSFGQPQNVSSVQNIIKNLQDHKATIGFQKVGNHIDLYDFREPEYNQTISPVMVDFSYYQGQNSIPDTWLINASWESLYDKLLQHNAMLCPYLPNQNFSVGDSITLQHTNVYNVTCDREITIVGLYRYFPLEMVLSHPYYPDELFTRSYLISSASNIPWYPASSLEVTYQDLSVSRIELLENIASFMDLVYPEIGYSTSSTSPTEYRPLTYAIFKYFSIDYEYATSEFIQLIILYFLLFIALLLVIEIDPQHAITKANSSNLRNLGISRKNLFYYELMKFNIILGGSALFSLTGILSLKMIYIIQNVIHERYQALFTQDLRQIYVALGFVILYIGIISLIKLWEQWYATKHTKVTHSTKERK